MQNSQISQIFTDIADILEIKGENRFRIRAYQRAAQTIAGLSQDIRDFIKENRLNELSGIGKDLSKRIQEFVATGKIQFYEDIKKTLPEGLLDLLEIPSVGPKTAKTLYETLKIQSISDLEKAITQGKLEGIRGIKAKTIENIQKGIAILKKGRERMTLAQAVGIANEFICLLKALPEVKTIVPAGSLRRQKETVRDIDILIISSQPQRVMDAFVKLPMAKEILAHGPTKSSVRIAGGIQVDCRVEPEKSFGAALLYFTGSKDFNIKLRILAQKKGLKINEYGVFRTNQRLAGKTEDEIFKLLDLAYIEPEMREDKGEIELAIKNQLPRLIALKDIKGDLHVHSSWSDGNSSIAELAYACQKRGYSYVAVTDHSQGLKVASGLSIADLRKKRVEIDALNKRLRGLRILYGTEVDIGSDGRLDYADNTLREFDVVVAAIHAGFKQSAAQLTKRIIKACQNKYVNIIAHPTGRLWGTRDAYALTMEEIFKAARDTNTSLEINSFPHRLDLNDLHARRAKEIGVKTCINTDAHTVDQLDTMQLGISVARRGWLEKEDVINTLSLEELLKAIKK